MKLQAGELLVEALVAISLIGLAMAGLVTVLVLLQQARIVSAERGEAAIIAASQLDRWEGQGGPPPSGTCTQQWVAGVSGLARPVRYRVCVAADVTVSTYPRAYPLSVTVSWHRPGGALDSLSIATGWAAP